MGLKRTKLLGIQAVTGINTVGILTVGTPPAVGVVPTVKIPTVLIPVTACIPSNFVLLSPIGICF